MVSRRLYIHATNVHMGGGLTLLKAIINALPVDIEVVLCLDKRVQKILNMPQNVQIKYVEPTLIQRLAAEKWLSRNVAFHDVVLCFGNLPPLFKLRGHVSVFVQNCVQRSYFQHNLENIE